MLKTYMEATITDCKPLSHRVIWLHLQLGMQPFKYEPGQIVAINIDGESDRQPDWKYFSIASAPNGHNGFELCVSDSKLSPDTLVGKKVAVKGPAGSFTLPKVIDKDLVFIATGTGIAPFRGMIHHIFEHQMPHKKIHLIQGCRSSDEILYREEFEKIARENPEFTYDIILSRASQEEWYGRRGRVRDVYLQQYHTPRPDVLFYLCGWPEMVKDGIKDLVEVNGFHTHQLVYELFY